MTLEREAELLARAPQGQADSDIQEAVANNFMGYQQTHPENQASPHFVPQGVSGRRPNYVTHQESFENQMG